MSLLGAGTTGWLVPGNFKITDTESKHTRKYFRQPKQRKKKFEIGLSLLPTIRSSYRFRMPTSANEYSFPATEVQ